MLRKMFSMSLMVAVFSMLIPGLSNAAENVTIGIVCEITGGGAMAGINWERGVLMAVEEINATGGVLGRKIETFTIDTKSEPPVSVAAMKKAIERNPFVVFGTVWSPSTVANMSILQEAGIPQFTGALAPGITQKGNPNIFRTAHNADLSVHQVIQLITDVLKVKKLAIFYSIHTWGKEYHDSLVKLLEEKAKDLKIVSDIAVQLGQTDFTGELVRAKASGPDAFAVALLEEDCARFLIQMKEMGLQKSVRNIGNVNSLAPTTIRLAGDAADGIIGTVDLTPMALPLKPLSDKYQKKYRELPDHNFFKAYMGLQVVKAAVEEIGVFDQQKLRDYLRNRAFCVKNHPGITMDVYYDDKGDIDRESFLVETINQKHAITGILPPMHPERFEKCKK